MTLRYSRSTASVRSIASGCSGRSRSTPWPRRVICVRRSIDDELGIGTAAVDVGDEQPGRVGAHVDRGNSRHCRFSSHPTDRPDRRRPRGDRRDARAGTSRPGPCRRLRRSDGARRGRVRARHPARGAYARAREPSSSGATAASAGAYAAARLQSRDPQREVRIDEPVARRHRGTVVEQRSVADDGRVALRVAHHDLESRPRLRGRGAASAPRTSYSAGVEVGDSGVRGRHEPSVRNQVRERS